MNSDLSRFYVSFFPSFFLFFCRLFWKLLIFVSVNPTFLQLGVQFCWLCFLCLPCTYSVERRFVFRAFVFCAPILIVVSMGQVFCCFSQILFWKQSQVPGSSRCKSVFVFIATSHFSPFHELLYVFRDVSKLLASDNCLTFNCSSNAIQQHQFRILFKRL